VSRARVVILSFLLACTALGSAARPAVSPTEALYEQFRNPPAHHGLMPYWYWNGAITPEETRRQIQSMLDQGVHGAIVFPWDGMEIPFLTEPWWNALGHALDTAAELGFTLNLNDDFTWPSGHAWDHYQQGAELSRVLADTPAFRMRMLAEEEETVRGGRRWQRTFEEAPAVVVAGRVQDDGRLDHDSLRLLEPKGHTMAWRVPAGTWKVFTYTSREVTGAHNTRVDLLNPAAVRKYIEIVYEELARRFPQHLGRTLRLTTADHEGTFGVNPVHTPGFWDAFQRRHGYDLRPLLPLLRGEADHRAAKVRWDYFDLVSDLYRFAFVEQVTEWCRQYGIDHAASFYEEQLAIQVRQAGDMFGLWRTMSVVEIDALLERARMPIDFKEAVSVAHFERKPLAVENQGLQGHDSYLSPEKMRLGSNMALLWGANLLVPYFDYDPGKVHWPPQWFESQPFWRYFRHYADYVRRVSFMNSRGRHIAPVALFYPLDSAWANSQPMFGPRNGLQWHNVVDDIEAYYSALQLLLAHDGWDYHILDSHYLRRASVENGRLEIADEAFDVLILPPLTTIPRAALEQIRAFADAGGAVLAVTQLPTGSPEAGDDDPIIRELVERVFGAEAVRGERSRRAHGRGGSAHFFPTGRHDNFMNVLNYMREVEVPEDYRRDLAPVLDALQQYVRREVEVIRGEPARLYASHREENGTHFYWIVNDTDQPRTVTLRFGASGGVEQWDPLSGDRRPLPARAVPHGTELELDLEAWGGTYVVIAGGLETAPTTAPRRVVQSIDLTGHPWRLTAETDVLVPYAEVRTGAAGQGDREGWARAGDDREGWTDEWLSVERLANPSWWLIGPFPYGDHLGYNEVFPPERHPDRVDLEAVYDGQDGAAVRWRYLTSPTYWVDARGLLEIPRPANSVAYAYSDIYSPAAREAQIRVAFADSVKVWWNGDERLAVHRHPKWMLLRDPWAERAPITIRQGWNRVLVKITRSENRPISFLFRIADEHGNTLQDLRYSRATDGAVSETLTPAGEKWYRVEAPPGTRSLVVPEFSSLRQVYVDGGPVSARPGQRIDLSGGVRRPVIAFRCGAGEQLERPIRFIGGATDVPLRSWTLSTLANYSGVGVYTTSFPLPRLAQGDRVTLDLGTVGVAAEVWLNGMKMGERVWSPYTFDLSPAARSGSNLLRVLVANSDANWQAQGDPIYPFGSWGMRIHSERERLQAVERNGLLGPVTVTVERSE
jgi:hypothetical protein